MEEKNSATVRGEDFEFEEFAGYEFGVDADGTSATVAVKFKVLPEEGLKMAQRLEAIRTKVVS